MLPKNQIKRVNAHDTMIVKCYPKNNSFTISPSLIVQGILHPKFIGFQMTIQSSL